MKSLDELLIEKDKLQKHLDWGKDILCFEELNWVRNRLKEIDSDLNQASLDRERKNSSSSEQG